MKKQTENEKQINYITRKIVNLFKNCKLQEETKLVAICENENPVDYEFAEMDFNQKTVTLGASFDELSTYDKLLVVKAVINTHLQLTEGELPIYGRVLYFELQDNSQKYRAFGLDDEFMSVFK